MLQVAAGVLTKATPVISFDQVECVFYCPYQPLPTVRPWASQDEFEVSLIVELGMDQTLN